ncbi:hypothetical protein CEXT_337041 [Caerostris extrusa]|uniref:Uncharacterized protein n=1 Tax=Caerostris extrusa TaxID=172846 RepID=A0AAV4XQ91_CAEEX|nr:hypothetical protein CEXT_337041 [Caerostris extrusa]
MFSPRRRRGVIRNGPSSCFDVCRGESAENHSLSKEDCYWKHLPFFLVCAFRHSGLSGERGRGGENSAQFLKTKAAFTEGDVVTSSCGGGGIREGPLSCFEECRGESFRDPFLIKGRTATGNVFRSLPFVLFGIQDWGKEKRGLSEEYGERGIVNVFELSETKNSMSLRASLEYRAYGIQSL